IETVVRTGDGEVGVVFRYADASNYYSLRIGPESARLLRVSGGTTRELWGGPHGLGSGVSMRLAAMCDGYRLRCQLDDTLLCDLLDDDATAPLNGQAGLVAVDTAGAAFSEVLVR